jgi:formylglycine-generating enzyme required for sulfatase activity
MSFGLDQWRASVRAWWKEHGPRIKAAPTKAAYPLLAASAWLPFLAASTDDPGSAMTTLVGITAGVGSNLVANVVQNAYDTARGGKQVSEQAGEDAGIREEMDAILQATQALEAAQKALGGRWEEFAGRLAREMESLPGRPGLTVTLGDGAVVGGSVIAGDLNVSGGSAFIGRDQITITQGTHAQDTIEQQERALPAYLERLTTECNVLHLRGMDPRAADATRETMSLAAVYTALDTNRRVELRDEELAALGEQEREHLATLGEKQRGERPTRSLPALEVASSFDRLVLLGDPGAGKSTFVNHLAFRLARAALQQDDLSALSGWERGALVPLRIVLRDLARSPHLARNGSAASLWRFVKDALAEADLANATPALKERLDGRALLLLDGLDEVEVDARRRVLDAVADFCQTHRRTPILVTCRIYAYQEREWQLDGFEHTTLAPFDEGKINHFVDGWYAEVAHMGLMSKAEAEERAARLQVVAKRPDLRLLAPNPLLLTMMALLHSSWGRLPEDRVRLYSKVVELLLARWEESRLGREALTRARLSPGDLRFALEEVAYAAHDSQPAGKGTADVEDYLLRRVLAKGYLEGDWNRAADVIRYVRERAGLLLERKPGAYAFPHRTLQEYLAGCHLSVQENFPSRAADLVREDEARWREPFLLAVGKTARAENRVDLALSVVDNLCARDCPGEVKDERAWRCAWLAGEALLEIGADKLRQREAWKARLERVAGWLARLLEAGALAPAERAAAGRVLGQLGDPRDLDEVVFVPGGPFLMGSKEGSEGAYDDEYPQHTVEVADFCIGRYPVTNGQYARFVEARGYDERRYWSAAGWAWREGKEPNLSFTEDEDFRRNYAEWLKGRSPEKRDVPFWWDDPARNLPNLPVMGVCWHEALAYCNWLEETTGRECRLPSEAEWEKAARGAEGSTYPWGNDEIEPDRVNYDQTGIGRTSPVGCFPGGASPYGCLDMIGNVWERCSSVGYHEAAYPYRADDGREGLEENVVRALRGGSWFSVRRYCRCACRFDLGPDYFDDYMGFRVVFPGRN